MREENEMTEAMENPEWTEYRIKEEIKAAAELKEKELEIEKQIAYSEKVQLREMKLQAFKLAISIKPESKYNPMGGQMPTSKYSADDLIKDAEKIYESLIK